MDELRSKTTLDATRTDTHIWVNLVEEFEYPNASIHRAIEITPQQAREHAAKLIRFADEIENKNATG